MLFSQAPLRTPVRKLAEPVSNLPLKGNSINGHLSPSERPMGVC